MKHIIIFFAILFTVTQVSAQNEPDPIDYVELERQLKGDGLGGWVHASVKDQSLFVFTWRQPNNFFVNVQLPLISKDRSIQQQLANLKRHDHIIIKGEFADNDAPIFHVEVKEIVSINAWDGPSGDYEYDTSIPQDLLNKSEMIAKVHAVAEGGKVLVVEYGDRVLPVFNRQADLAKNLYRNDKILLQYRIRNDPNRPTHLSVNRRADEPIKVLESILDGHGETTEICGSLVMFPKSPQIIFNIYAIQIADADNIKRNYTVVNFQDMDLFTEIRLKLEAAWNAGVGTAMYDRNKFVNHNIHVCASGEKHVVSPNQANPQVLPSKIEDVVIDTL